MLCTCYAWQLSQLPYRPPVSERLSDWRLDSLWGAGTDADETSGESPFGKFAPLLQVVQTSPPGDSVVDDKGSPRLGASLIRFIYRSGLEPDVGETLTIEATHAPITLTVINNDAFLWNRLPGSNTFLSPSRITSTEVPDRAVGALRELVP